MLNYLNDWDTRLFLYLNGKHNGFFDVIMYWASNQFFWIPLYVCLFILLIRRFDKAAWYYFFCVALLEVASDQLSSQVIKDLVQRPRPSHVGSLAPYIHLSEAGPGGAYGFVSGHACNSFALAVFLILTLPPGYRLLKHAMAAWALLVSYSRIYNGVHYPGDVLCGAVLGVLLAMLVNWLFRHFYGTYVLLVRKWLRRHHADKIRSR
ncbi:MAG TPA: phosphatase PAP2 family protein [Puia sp.]|jgi:undecaprenyl-diphosphatase